MVWVDRHRVARLHLGKPGELHDRATGSGEDRRLDVLSVSLHLEALAAL